MSRVVTADIGHCGVFTADVGHCGVFIIVAFIMCIFEIIYTFLAWRANYKIYATQF